MKISLALPLSLSLSLLAGCAVPADDGDTEDTAEQALTPGDVFNPGGSSLPPAPAETPSSITFYAGQNQTGAHYTVALTPSSSGETTRVVPTSEISGAGLLAAVSSVRLSCGSRPSQVSLFDIDWGQFSKGTMLACDPGQVVTENLTGTLDNHANAAALVVHARSSDNGVHYVPFSYLLRNSWNLQLANLPSGATAGQSQIWLESWKGFRVYQPVTLDSPYCTARQSSFDLRVQVSTVNLQPVFAVTVVSEYVPYGFGDAWGCRTTMQSKLHDAVLSAVDKLKTSLPTIFLLLGQQPNTNLPLPSTTHYFAPQGYTTDFDAFMKL